jgi:hypothetical protein
MYNFMGDAMTGFLFKPLDVMKARAANCRAKARAWRKRAQSSATGDLRTSFVQIAETYDALADGVELRRVRDIPIPPLNCDTSLGSPGNATRPQR